jgi:desulfoferrodoxin (superoxide reductase-like protein)
MALARVRRRDFVRTIPIVTMGAALSGIFVRALGGCSEAPVPAPTRGPTNPPVTPPNDDDEFVPPNNTPPTNAGDAPSVPNPSWENRVKDLNRQQKEVFGASAPFSQTAPGQFAGKERSHVPDIKATPENGVKKVTVLVTHVMGANGLDAGAVDSGYDAKADAADAKADAVADAALDAKSDAEAGAPAGPTGVHFITTIFIKGDVNGAETVVGLWEFASTDAAPPSVKFTLPAGVTSVVAYEWCTLHGLWKSDALAV